MISLERGEPGERQVAIGFLGTLVAVMQRLANARARLTWVTSGYGWIGLVVPIVVASPGFFAGNMTLGGLIMVVGGFNQVQNALRWFIDNYPSIAEWQACLQRVTLLLDSLESVELHHDQIGRIALAASDGDRLVLDGLAVCLPGDLSTCILLDRPPSRNWPRRPRPVRWRPGQRQDHPVHGARRAVAMGPRHHPPAATFRCLVPARTAVSARGHVAPGPGLSGSRHRPRRRDVARAFRDVGLAHLVAELDVANHWDKDLSLDDQQRLSIARILLRRPHFAVLDDCLSALDDKSGRDLLAILRNRLPGTAIVSTSHRGDGDGFYRQGDRTRRRGQPAALHP